VAFWRVREELSKADRLRRSYYELLRDELDHFLIQYALIDSYNNFRQANLPYPFVEKRELKPRARIPDVEYEKQNTFLVIFVEDIIPEEHKKYVRFFDVNRTLKTNLLHSKTLPLIDRLESKYKYLESTHFYDFLKILLPVDYALLVQRDPATKAKNRYTLTHFHVRIDWPIAEAAEDLARTLRYISKELYEKGDKYAEDIQKKFFEYYCLPVMAGGRRTAAIVAAQYLKRIPCISTVYAGSSETRALIRVSERGVSKIVLMQLSERELEQIGQEHGLTLRQMKKNYVVENGGKGKGCTCLFQATYAYTSHSRPPEDGKLREIKFDLSWLTVGGQHLLPKPGVLKRPPLATNLIYT
jgi:hypothetical protein